MCTCPPRREPDLYSNATPPSPHRRLRPRGEQAPPSPRPPPPPSCGEQAPPSPHRRLRLASALGGSKHRPAPPRPPPLRYLRGFICGVEHVRWAHAARAHPACRHRGREVEGVASAGLKCGTARRIAAPALRPTVPVEATQPYVASHCSATHERLLAPLAGVGRVVAAVPRGRKGRSNGLMSVRTSRV